MKPESNELAVATNNQKLTYFPLSNNRTLFNLVLSHFFAIFTCFFALLEWYYSHWDLQCHANFGHNANILKQCRSSQKKWQTEHGNPVTTSHQIKSDSTHTLHKNVAVLHNHKNFGEWEIMSRPVQTFLRYFLGYDEEPLKPLISVNIVEKTWSIKLPKTT